MRVLVVDDERQYLFLLRDALEDEGHEVYTAEDGEEALERMAEVKIDFVISDVYMPVIDGVKLHGLIRAIPGYEKLPFLFVSAYDDQPTLDAVKKSKYEGFLKKGKSLETLKEWITYLSLPVNKRPTREPGTKSPRARRQERLKRRGSSNTPIY